MVSIETEEAIRTLLKDKLNDREIARLVGVSPFTVGSVRRASEIASKLTAQQQDEIKSLLLLGLSAEAVSVRTRVPRSLVLAVRRCHYLQQRDPGTKEARQCPTCGSVMHPKAETECPPAVCPENKEGNPLRRVVADLLALDNLHLIPHPLFHNLARRAEEVIREATSKSQVG